MFPNIYILKKKQVLKDEWTLKIFVKITLSIFHLFVSSFCVNLYKITPFPQNLKQTFYIYHITKRQELICNYPQIQQFVNSTIKILLEHFRQKTFVRLNSKG